MGFLRRSVGPAVLLLGWMAVAASYYLLLPLFGVLSAVTWALTMLCWMWVIGVPIVMAVKLARRTAFSRAVAWSHFSDRRREFSKRSGKTEGGVGVIADFVVAAAEFSDEGEPGNDDLGGAVGAQPTQNTRDGSPCGPSPSDAGLRIHAFTLWERTRTTEYDS